MSWPAGRDVIWSGNVKITKDQFLSSGSLTKRLILLEKNQIAFHSDDDGVKDYSLQIAEMIGLESDSDFLQAGASHCLFQHVLGVMVGFNDPFTVLMSIRYWILNVDLGALGHICLH